VTKLLYGSAFKAPSPYLLYAQPLLPGGVIGNPNLKPQLVHTVEAVGSYRITKYLNLTADVAYSLLLDKAEFVPSGVNQTAENTATEQVGSFAATADLVLKDDVRAYASFELDKGYRETNTLGYLAQLVTHDLVVYPQFIARAGIHKTWSTSDQVRIRLGTQLFVAGRRIASDNNVRENLSSYSLPAYAEWDALAGVETRANTPTPLLIQLRATNLLDQRAVDPGFAGIDYPRAAREVFLELRRAL
jgi:iron complex outermembrane receptor protein